MRNQATFCIKTIHRPHCCAALVRSIHEHYGDDRPLIHILDDGKPELRFTAVCPDEAAMADKVIITPYDIGLSAGRNRYGYHAAAVHGLSRRMHEVAPDLMCVPSFNSGVLFLRRSSIIQRAMRRWRNHYRGGEVEVALTKALLETRTPTYCLPCEWNYRGFGLNQ